MSPIRSGLPIQSGNQMQYKDVSKDCIRVLAERGIDALVCIGGDGTMATAAQFAKKGLTVMGVPKTIDNDLYGTDVTFGFDTAVTTATEAIDKVHTTASSHHRVMIVEVMGRYAGWIALHAGVAGGADIILIPEIPYDVGQDLRVCPGAFPPGQTLQHHGRRRRGEGRKMGKWWSASASRAVPTRSAWAASVPGWPTRSRNAPAWNAGR